MGSILISLGARFSDLVLPTSLRSSSFSCLRPQISTQFNRPDDTAGSGSPQPRSVRPHGSLIDVMLADHEFQNISGALVAAVNAMNSCTRVRSEARALAKAFRLTTFALVRALVEEQNLIITNFGSFEIRPQTRAEYRHPISLEFKKPRFQNRIIFFASDRLTELFEAQNLGVNLEVLGSARLATRLQEEFGSALSDKDTSALVRVYLRSIIKVLISDRAAKVKGILGNFYVLPRRKRSYMVPKDRGTAQSRFKYRAMFSPSEALHELVDRVQAIRTNATAGFLDVEKDAAVFQLLQAYRSKIGLKS